MSIIKKLGFWSIIGAILFSYLTLMSGKLAYQAGLLNGREAGIFVENNSFLLSFPFPNDVFTILFAITNSYPITFGILLILDALSIFTFIKIMDRLSDRASIACVATYWVLSCLAFTTLVPLGIVILMGKGHS